MMEQITCNLSKITKSYNSIAGKIIHALKNINITVKPNEFLTVVGKSGSGKSTLLKLLAGIEHPTEGKIEWSIENEHPRIGFVFQDNAIFPWRTVYRNITYSMELRKVNKEIQKKKAYEICYMIGLNPEIFLTKYPKELSGGEKRRVAIGMALAHDATFLLLDEPTSQLDDINKFNFQNVLQKLWAEKRFTSVLVTHDIEEAIYLGDRVLVLNQGNIAAVIEIDLPRPRESSLRRSKEFLNYRSQIMNYFPRE